MMWTQLCSPDDLAIIISLAVAFGMVIGALATLWVAITDPPIDQKVVRIHRIIPVEPCEPVRFAVQHRSVQKVPPAPGWPRRQSTETDPAIPGSHSG